VWGNGEQEREFLHVADAADGIIAAALHANEDVLNLGTGCAYSVGHIARVIKEAADFRGEIVFNSQRFTGVRRRVLDVSRMRDVIGWSAPTSIEAGLAATVAWYERQLGTGGDAGPHTRPAPA
jgi:GDP-L-fucose synthase